MLGDQEQRERLHQPLAGEIFQAKRLKKGQKGAVIFAKEGLGLTIELPEKQAELIGGYLAKRPPEDCYFWVYSEEGFRGKRGVVIAGPLNEKIEKSLNLLSDVQMARWFNQFLSPLNEVNRVEEINLTERPTFKVGGDKTVSFKEIREAFKEEEEREKGGLRKKRKYEREIKRLLPMKGIRGEAARRHRRIGKD